MTESNTNTDHVIITREENKYEMKIRILGNEIFAINLSASDKSNKMFAFGLITIFCALTILGAYGEKFITLFKML